MSQEPVAWTTELQIEWLANKTNNSSLMWNSNNKEKMGVCGESKLIPLYTAPRELSDDEIADVAMHCSDMDEYGNSKLDEVAFAKALLKKASEK